VLDFFGVSTTSDTAPNYQFTQQPFTQQPFTQQPFMPARQAFQPSIQPVFSQQSTFYPPPPPPPSFQSPQNFGNPSMTGVINDAPFPSYGLVRV
jgi:hypothetical protein